MMLVLLVEPLLPCLQAVRHKHRNTRRTRQADFSERVAYGSFACSGQIYPPIEL
jgi:hypothetical protein